MRSTAVHKDPTFEAVANMEISEKGCHVCTRRVELSCGELRCGVNKKFPFCRGARPGFVLDLGESS